MSLKDDTSFTELIARLSKEVNDQDALDICKRYLLGWAENVTIDTFSTRPLTGGLSNRLYICSTTVEANLKQRSALLRIYGGNMVGDALTSLGLTIHQLKMF